MTIALESARSYHVGKASGMYPTVRAAVDAINAGPPLSGTQRAVINVWPGFYTHTDVVTVPSWVGIKGVSKGLVQFRNDTTDLFRCSSHVWFEDFLIEGSATSSVYAFDCDNKNAIHVRNVDMLNALGAARQKFLKQSGSTWTVLFIEHCIIDYFGTSGYSVLLENTAASARLVDTVVNDLLIDAYNLSTWGGSFQLRGIRDVRINRSTIRGIATHNTGVRLELAGVTGTPSAEIRHTSFANVENGAGGVSIYNEAGTHVYLANTEAPASAFAGGVTIRNSHIV
jgi:hypothetical protein